jgi:hypothetical protein
MRNWPVAALLAVAASIVLVGLATSFAPRPVEDAAGLASALEQRDTELAQLAHTYAVPETEAAPDIVRWVGIGETTSAMVACLQAADVAATALPGDSYRIESFGDFKPGSTPTKTAIWRCIAKYPSDPRTVSPFTQQQIRILYDYYTKELSACLGSHGILIEPAPGFDSFLEKWGHGTRPWNPWDHSTADDVTQPALDKLAVDCPRYPPDSLLFGRPLPQPGG